MTDLPKPTAEGEVKPCPFCGKPAEVQGPLFHNRTAYAWCECINPCRPNLVVWNSRPLEEAAAQREAEQSRRIEHLENTLARTTRDGFEIAAERDSLRSQLTAARDLIDSILALPDHNGLLLKLRAALETS